MNRRFRVRWICDDATGCWNWTGSIARTGYGIAHPAKGTSMTAHRWVWLNLRGPVDKGLHVDHLCRNRRCVNPDHLEPVTPAENTRRKPKTATSSTHCKKGHSLWDAYRYPNGRRYCRTCTTINGRLKTERQRAARLAALVAA